MERFYKTVHLLKFKTGWSFRMLCWMPDTIWWYTPFTVTTLITLLEVYPHITHLFQNVSLFYKSCKIIEKVNYHFFSHVCDRNMYVLYLNNWFNIKTLWKKSDIFFQNNYCFLNTHWSQILLSLVLSHCVSPIFYNLDILFYFSMAVRTIFIQYLHILL